MKICIHRGAQEIGGTVIELATDKTKLLIDIGLPLSKFSRHIDVTALKPDAVLISHPHQDHFGLIDQLDISVPVYVGELGKNLIFATSKFRGQELPDNNFCHFEKWQPFKIGDFQITPYLMDHSAVDAYAFLVEADGKKVFYSGDFRASGNKAFLFDKLLHDPPPNIDLLLMEGTMMRRNSDRFPDEASVRCKIEEILKKQQNITFLIASSQNIDRLVSAIHACQKTDKTLVIDFYTAWILEKVSQVSYKVPTIDWKQVKVYADYRMNEIIKNDPDFFGDFQRRLYGHRVKKDELEAEPSRYLYYSKMSRFRIMELYKKFGPINIIYSQWLGYLNLKNDGIGGAKEISAYQNDPLVNFTYAHTSGHATLDILHKMVEALQPAQLIPIHTEHPNDYAKHFDRVITLKDGEPIKLS
jgi:ribonuclease J